MALTQVDQGLLGTNAQYTGFKNRIINGAMVIDQRNAGASISAGDGAYGVDRFAMYYQTGIASKGTIQQTPSATETGYATRVAAGFSNYLAFTSNSAYLVASGDAILINQRIEGYNIADLAWGTANAKTVTLSFWVYSSLTGTFGGTLRNSAGTQYYPYSYTISSANTWEQKTITIAGSTTGTWVSTNGIGVYVMFGLGVGSSLLGTANAWSSSAYFSPTGATSVVGTNTATFYITGVQLEKGSTATSFDYRPYGTELQLCQRYYLRISNLGATTNNQAFLNGVVKSGTNAGQCGLVFIVPMRASPTGSYTGAVRIYDGSVATAITSIGTQESSYTVGSLSLNASGGGLTTGRIAQVLPDGSNFCTFDFSAEL